MMVPNVSSIHAILGPRKMLRVQIHIPTPPSSDDLNILPCNGISHIIQHLPWPANIHT